MCVCVLMCCVWCTLGLVGGICGAVVGGGSEMESLRAGEGGLIAAGGASVAAGL